MKSGFLKSASNFFGAHWTQRLLRFGVAELLLFGLYPILARHPFDTSDILLISVWSIVTVFASIKNYQMHRETVEFIMESAMIHIRSEAGLPSYPDYHDKLLPMGYTGEKIIELTAMIMIDLSYKYPHFYRYGREFNFKVTKETDKDYSLGDYINWLKKNLK